MFRTFAARPPASMLAACAFTLCMLALGLSGCSLAGAARGAPIDLHAPAVIPAAPADGERYPLSPPSAARGAAIYGEKCAACHGAGGAGDGTNAALLKAQGARVADLTDPARLRTVKPVEWHSTISVGRIQKLMPPFSGSLSAQQRWDVLAYVWTLGLPADQLAPGRAAYAAQCAACHGAVAQGAKGPALNSGPMLADTTLAELASRMNSGAAHSVVKLTESERMAVASSVRAFGYEYVDPKALSRVRDSGDGSLAVRAQNNTPGAPPGAGMVTLRALDTSGEVFSRTAPLNGAGVAVFNELPRRADYFFQPEFDHGGGLFYGQPAQFTSTTSISTILPYYETRVDDGGIQISSVLIAVQDIREGALTMVEVYEFALSGDRAYVGQDKRTLRVNAPVDALNLRFDGLGFGKRFSQQGDVIYDSEVTTPGAPAQRITMIYELPYSGARAITRTLFYPAARFAVFMPDTAALAGTPLRASGPGLKDEGTREAEGATVRVYSGEASAVNSGIAFEINGHPRALAQNAGNPALQTGMALLALASALGLCVLLALRVRALRAAPSGPTAPADPRGALIATLAALDDRRAQLAVDEDTYARERERLLAALRAIWE